MDSFFSRIKAKLKYDLGGRYLAEILKEIIKENLSIAYVLWGNDKRIKRDFIEIQVEWPFPDRQRRADLAVIDKRDRVPIALLEIKYEDEKDQKNLAQLDDYLDYCKNRNVLFTYLTKNLPPEEDLNKVGDKYLSFAKLVHKLEKRREVTLAVRMLCDFLREEGYVFEIDIDLKALMLLMVKSLGFPHSQGFRRLNTFERITKDVPRTFEGILNNASVLGSRVYEEFGRDLFSQRPTIDYRFSPYLNINKTHKRFTTLKDNSEEPEILAVVNTDEVVAGDFWVVASIKFPGGDNWMYLNYGFYFYLEKGEALSTELFAEISKSKASDSESIDFRLGMNEDQIYRKLLKILNKLIARFNRKFGDEFLDEQKKVMETLLNRIKGK